MPVRRLKASLGLGHAYLCILLNSVGLVALALRGRGLFAPEADDTLYWVKELTIFAVSCAVFFPFAWIGRGRSLIVSIALPVVFCVAGFFVPSTWFVMSFGAAVGASFALWKVALFSGIGDVARNETEHISLMTFAEGCFMLGGTVVGSIFGCTGNNATPTLGGAKLGLLIVAAIGLVTVFLMAPFWKKVGDGMKELKASEHYRGMLELVITPLGLTFMATNFFYVLIERGAAVWFDEFSSRVVHVPNAATEWDMHNVLAAMLCLGRFAACVGILYVSWLRMLVTCLFIEGVLILLATQAALHSTSVYTVGPFVAPLAGFIFPFIVLFLTPIYPVVNSVCLSALPRERQPQMAGLIQIFATVGSVLAIAVTKWLFRSYGGTSAFYFVLVPICGIVICLMFLKSKDPRKAIGSSVAVS